MSTQVQQSIAPVIGTRIRKARKRRGLTQEQLATPQFTKGYISALERGAVRPSLKALEYLAARLELPLSHFVVGVEKVNAEDQQGGTTREPEIEALQEDLNYQYNYARMLIRSGRVEEALELIQTAEAGALRY